MTPPLKKHPDVRVLVPRFLAWYELHPAWERALHVCLADGNYDLAPDEDSAESEEELVLVRIVRELTPSQRAKLVRLVQAEYFRRSR